MHETERASESRIVIAAIVAVVLTLAVTQSIAHPGARPARDQPPLAAVAQFDNVPVGIAVSRDRRLFLAFSRAIDETEPFSVGEVRDGKAVPYPAGFQQDRGPGSPTRLLSVQALTVDARNRLWILDSGRVGGNDTDTDAVKLVAVDLATDAAVRTIRFPPQVVGKTTFLNDVVVDLSRGKEGTAFLTDAAPKGPNGIVVVDLASGTSRRRLDDHPSTKPAPGFVIHSEGRPLIQKIGPDAGKPLAFGADGIALSSDGRSLYYSPIASHHWYRADAGVLADAARGAADAARTVEDLGDKGFAADGMLGSADGPIFVTDVEGNAIHRRRTDGAMEVLVRDPRLLWPDSMALAADGTLFVTATQIERGKNVRGTDQRRRPFTVWSVATGSKPLLLGK
jgi:sugar lactone lactonase YvrE